MGAPSGQRTITGVSSEHPVTGVFGRRGVTERLAPRLRLAPCKASALRSRIRRPSSAGTIHSPLYRPRAGRSRSGLPRPVASSIIPPCPLTPGDPDWRSVTASAAGEIRVEIRQRKTLIKTGEMESVDQSFFRLLVIPPVRHSRPSSVRKQGLAMISSASIWLSGCLRHSCVDF